MKNLLFGFVIILFFCFSCQDQSVTPSSQNEMGEISFSMNMSSAPKEVVDISGYLSRTSFDTIYFNFAINNDTATASVGNIIAGQWKLTVNALNNNNVIIYSGSTDVYVSPGISTPVYLQLNPTTGSLEIIVTWGSYNSIDSMLVAYYPFNGNANDESGNGHDGTIYGAVLADDHYGNPNSAYFFDGIDDYIDIGNNSSLKPQLPISYSLWVNYVTVGEPLPIFANNYDDSDNYFGAWVVITNANYIQIGYGDGGPIGPTSRRVRNTSSVTTPGVWYHFVGIIRGPLDMDIYLNGINNAGVYTGGGGPILYNNNPANFGRLDSDNSGPAHFFNGRIDELRIYNRELNESEVQALFNE